MKAQGTRSVIATAARVLPLCAAIGVPFFFVYSTWIAARLEKALRLEVEPSFTGGRLLAEFPNPIGGDTGQGGYTYPLGQGWEKGELNLVRYAVRAPVPRPVWGFSGAYWQLEASFAKAMPTGLAGGGFRAPVLHVYIQIRESGAGGSTESAFGEGELLRFDPDHPWDYALSADGWSPAGEIRSADGSYRAPVPTMWDFARRRLILRIRLENAPRLLASVIGGASTWHYVLVGAYDPAREGHFAAVRRGAGLHDGGGAKDDLSPRVFDLIAPKGTSKSAELSSEDPASGNYALVSPVMAGGPAAAGPSPALRGRAAEAAAKEAAAAEAARSRALAALPPRSPADSGVIGELFELGLEDRCLEAIKADIAARPGDPVALAYRGAILAQRADRAAGLGEKMRLVAEAYRDLDAAVAGSAAAARGGPHGRPLLPRKRVERRAQRRFRPGRPGGRRFRRRRGHGGRGEGPGLRERLPRPGRGRLREGRSHGRRGVAMGDLGGDRRTLRRRQARADRQGIRDGGLRRANAELDASTDRGTMVPYRVEGGRRHEDKG